MLIVDGLGVAVVASIAKAAVEAPSTANIVGAFGGPVNLGLVDDSFGDEAVIQQIDAKQRACVKTNRPSLAQEQKPATAQLGVRMTGHTELGLNINKSG